MNIKELIQSSGNVYHRGKSQALAKQMGKVLLNNQMVTVYKNQTVVDISMMISGVTDMIKSGDSSKPVAFHKVTISIKGIDQTYYTPSQLVAKIRADHPEYADEKKYINADILKITLENPTKFFDDATVFRTTNDSGKGFSVVSNNISEDSEVQVWCSCSDYYWTFQYYNCENEVDKYGKYPDRYIPKTKAGYDAFKQNAPLRNPTRSPGMCKHLMLLMATLMEKGIVEDKSNMNKYYKANYSNFQMEKRLSISQYDNRVEKYIKDHNLKVRQRKIERDKPGWKKSGWNNKTGRFNRTTKLSNGGTFNANTGVHNHPRKRKKGK
jgi:hypothetical protein